MAKSASQENSKIKSFCKKLFPAIKESENFLQYIFRQLFIPDSKGKPSITVTILFFVMLMVGVVAYTETQNAQVMITQQTEDKVLITKPLGYTDNFYYLVILLSGTITAFYRSRQNKVGSEEPGETKPGLLDKIIDAIKK